MSAHLRCTTVFFTFTAIFSLVALSSPAMSTKISFKALVTPITKDLSTSLFTINLNSNSNSSFVLDISTQLSWLRCNPPSSFPRVSCSSKRCNAAYNLAHDISLCRITLPGPTTKHPVPGGRNCFCISVAINPVAKRCAVSRLTSASFSISTTDGHNPLAAAKVGPVYASCAPKKLFASLPIGAAGLASLSRGQLSLPTQLSKSPAKLAKQFGICLPSSISGKGVAFFGTGPFFVLPPPGRNLNNWLQYTPLITKRPSGHTHTHDYEYYIGVKGIAINQDAVKFQTKMLGFDSQGRGGVKLSTVIPYGTMRTPLYKAFLNQYKRATSGIPRAHGPFDLCLNTTNLGSTRVGLPVAQVDLQLSNGKNWTIFSGNSFKRVADDVSCLAYVDGGEKAEQAFVIGSFQIEDNFLLFDLENSRLGISSALAFFQTGCANFNFTSEL